MRFRIQPAPKRKRFDPRAFPASVRDRVEIDYAKKLTPEERGWLASFNESEFGANPDHLEDITGEPITVEERRKAWREIKQAQRNKAVQIESTHYSVWLSLYEARITQIEDSLIEVIDRFDELERIVVSHLKADIMEKYGRTFEGINVKAQ